MGKAETLVPIFAFRNLGKPRKPYIRRSHNPCSKWRPLEFETKLVTRFSHLTSHESSFNLLHQEESIVCRLFQAGSFSRESVDGAWCNVLLLCLCQYQPGRGTAARTSHHSGIHTRTLTQMVTITTQVKARPGSLTPPHSLSRLPTDEVHPTA